MNRPSFCLQGFYSLRVSNTQLRCSNHSFSFGPFLVSTNNGSLSFAPHSNSHSFSVYSTGSRSTYWQTLSTSLPGILMNHDFSSLQHPIVILHLHLGFFSSSTQLSSDSLMPTRLSQILCEVAPKRTDQSALQARCLGLSTAITVGYALPRSFCIKCSWVDTLYTLLCLPTLSLET